MTPLSEECPYGCVSEGPVVCHGLMKKRLCCGQGEVRLSNDHLSVKSCVAVIEHLS